VAIRERIQVTRSRGHQCVIRRWHLRVAADNYFSRPDGEVWRQSEAELAVSGDDTT